jgi:hypothetical protein
MGEITAIHYVPGHGLNRVHLTVVSVGTLRFEEISLFIFMQNVPTLIEILLHKLLTNQNHINAVFAIKLRKLVSYDSKNFAFRLLCL